MRERYEGKNVVPFVFVVIGLLFLVSAIRGTQNDMFALIKSEFWGTNSFVPWAAAIMILGAIGYAKPVRPIADAMIGLIVLVMILANKGGFFKQINQGLANPVSPTATTAAATASGTQQASVGGGTVPAATTDLWTSLVNAFSGAPSGPTTPGYAPSSGATPGGGANILNTPSDPIDIFAR